MNILQELKTFTGGPPRTEKRLSRVSIGLNRIADMIERRAPWIACILLLGILFVGVVKALYLPLNFDELYTTFVSRFPHTSEFWSFARTGADGQPPFYYYLTKAGIWLAKNEQLGVRLPSIAAYVALCLSLYIFISRIATKIYGLGALLAPAMTGCWYYMTEARPYGIVLGCTGLAAICWQSVAIRQHRAIALAGMALSLACALAVHFFSVLVLLPFGIAEVVRTIRRKKLDVAVWMALASPLFVLLPTVPVAIEASSNGGVRAYPLALPGWYGSLAAFCSQFIAPLILSLVIMAVMYMAVQSTGRFHDAPDDCHVRLKVKESSPEIALILALTCLPLLTVALGKFVSHSLYARYGIAAMFGVVTLIFLVIWRAAPEKLASVGVMLLFCGIFIYSSRLDLRHADDERANPNWKHIQESIPKAVWQDQLPIAFGEAFTFMELSYYGDAALRHRMCYLASPEYELLFAGANNTDIGMIKSGPYFGMNIVDYKTWTKSHRVFYLLSSQQRFGIRQLIRDQARLELLQDGLINSSGVRDLFFRVTMPAE